MVAPLLLASILALPAAGQEPPASHVRAELIAGQDSVAPGKAFPIALRLTMTDGWHTYWKNPGDSGMATSLEWKLPKGFQASEAQWPFPERFSSGPIVGYGYKGQASLVWDITAPPGLAEGRPVVIAAKVKWLECRELCIPGKADLSVTLRARSGAPKPNPDLAKARVRLPGALGIGAFSGWTARAFHDEGRIRLRVVSKAGSRGFVDPKNGFDIAFFPYDDGVIEDGQETPARTDGATLTLELPRSRAPQSKDAARLSGVLALRHQGRAVEISIPIEKIIQ